MENKLSKGSIVNIGGIEYANLTYFSAKIFETNAPWNNQSVKRAAEELGISQTKIANSKLYPLTQFEEIAKLAKRYAEGYKKKYQPKTKPSQIADMQKQINELSHKIDMLLENSEPVVTRKPNGIRNFISANA